MRAEPSGSPAAPVFADASTELSSRRTGMSFQRTRLSADRTLMSVIRTSLSLISFGFTIVQLFHQLRKAGTLPEGQGSARGFGLGLIALGVFMLVLGIVYHGQFMVGLRRERAAMKGTALIHAESGFPVSLTLIVAVLLLLLGIFAFGSVVFL